MEYTQLNELYIGRKPIEPLQNQLSIFRDKVKGKPYTQSINVDKDLLKFNRLVEKMFGFSSYALTITPENYLDGYTWSMTTLNNKENILKINKKLQATKNGFKHDPNVNLHIITNISNTLFNYEELTNEELMAIILHEIGHQFFLAVTDEVCIYAIFDSLIGAIQSINKRIISRISSGNNIRFDDIKNDVNEITNKFGINNFLNNIKNRILSVPRSLRSIPKFLSNKFFRESMEDNMKRNRIEYTDEKFADSFAVMYGYGIELHTSFTKFDKWFLNNTKVKPESRNGVIISFKTFINMTKDLIAYIRDSQEDEHPTDLARLKVSIEYLKRELAKEGLDPKVKLELMKQINDMQKLIDDYINFPRDKDYMAVRRAYYKELYRRFGGDRREQDTDNKALFDAIDKRFDEILNDK